MSIQLREAVRGEQWEDIECRCRLTTLELVTLAGDCNGKRNRRWQATAEDTDVAAGCVGSATVTADALETVRRAARPPPLVGGQEGGCSGVPGSERNGLPVRLGVAVWVQGGTGAPLWAGASANPARDGLSGSRLQGQHLL